MRDNKYFIQLENEWFHDNDNKTLLDTYGKYGLLIYSILLRGLNNRGVILLSMNHLCSQLNIDTRNNRKKLSLISDAIEYMNGNLFDIYSDGHCMNLVSTKLNNKDFYYIRLKRDRLNGNFFMLYDYDVDAIINTGSDRFINNVELMSIFAYISMSLTKDKSSCKYMTTQRKISTISSKCNIPIRSCVRYIKILIDENIILCGNSGKADVSESYKNDINLYGVPDHKDSFDKALKDLKKSEYVDANKEAQNNQRRVKQSINLWMKHNNHPSESDLTRDQWDEINHLELEYMKILKDRGRNKAKGGIGFLTIKLDGSPK